MPRVRRDEMSEDGSTAEFVEEDVAGVEGALRDASAMDLDERGVEILPVGVFEGSQLEKIESRNKK
jgi:hypothetical protein